MRTHAQKSGSKKPESSGQNNLSRNKNTVSPQYSNHESIGTNASHDFNRVPIHNDPIEEEAVEGLSDKGTPLPSTQRSGFESGFGENFSDVRIHTGPKAIDAASAINARAFTFGQNIGFDAGQFETSTSEGRGLISHELAHVVQQRSIGPQVQRKKWQYPDPEMTKYETIGKSFTVLKPKKLKSKGPFTQAVLHDISDTFTENAAWHDPKTAHMILKALESSKAFVRIAKKLDKYYKKKKTPGISVGASHKGSRFVPMGQRAGYGFAEDKDEIKIDYETVTFDPRRPSRSANPEYQSMAYVRLLVHETAHAYRHAYGTHKKGLKGRLYDESETRKLETKMLSQISKRLKKSKKTGMLDQLKIQQSNTGSQKQKEIAHNVVSGTRLSYLEDYYFGQALAPIYKEYESRKFNKPFEKLDDPKRADQRDVKAFRKALDERLTHLRKAIKDYGPKPAQPTKPAASKTASGSPASKIVSAPPKPTLLSAGAKKLFNDLLAKDYSLKQISDDFPKMAKTLTDQEKAVFYYIAVWKIYDLRQGIYSERFHRNLSKSDPEYKDFIKLISEEYLGRPDAYKKY